MATAVAMTEKQTGWRTASIAGVVHETVDCRSFELEIDGPWQAVPGQYATIAVEIDGMRHVRSYSVSSVTGIDATTRITIKRQRQGLVSNWCIDQLRPGMVVELSPPMGLFTVQPGDGPLLFFAAGSGITPIFAMIRQALVATDRDVRLVHVSRRPDDAIFATELLALQRQFGERLHYRAAFTEGGRSTLDGLLAETLQGATNGDLYLCGPAAFMAYCERIAVGGGVPANRIYSESFGSASRESVPGDAAVATVMRTDEGAVRIDVAEGDTLLGALRQARRVNVGLCGGQGSCGTCRVGIAPDAARLLAPPTRSELRLLKVLAGAAPDHRLACQIIVGPDQAGLEFTPAPLPNQ